MRRLAALAALAAATLSLGAPAAQAAGPPQIDATWVTDVTATSDNLHAQVNPEGLTTTYHFEYIAEAAYQANLGANPPREGFTGAAKAPGGAGASLGLGSTDQPALQHIGNLKGATTYRYRIVATNAQGSAKGERNEEGEEVPHAFTTQEASPPSALPDNRGWEMVSPIDKDGGTIGGFGQSFGGGVFQAAANGEALTYSSASSFGAGAQGAPAAGQYLSRRGSGGWSTQNITVPLFSASYGNTPNGVPYQLFSPDLASGLLLNGQHCRGPGAGCPVVNPPLPGSGAPTGYQDYYLRDDEGGSFKALLTQADLAPLALSPEDFDLSFAGASPDLRHIVLSTCAALTPEATEVPSGGGGCEPAETNLYEWSGGTLSPINEAASHHAQLAAQAGAISTDGRRVYFTAGEDSPILLREEGQPTVLLPETVGGGATFQTASSDGLFAFFTKGGDLYRYDAGTETTSAPLATGVQGVLGASEDGSRVYYLTSTGLFLWQAPGTTTEIAPGPAAAFAGDYPPTTGTARVSPDGARLAFLSKARLTGYDNTDQSSGQPDSEVFLYEAGSGGGTLTCASCNPTGERPIGPSTIPGAISNGQGEGATDTYKPRALSAGGARLFFDSADTLAPQDTNLEPDAYQWEAQGTGGCRRPGGCLGLISSGRSEEGASFLDASVDGSNAFFLTDGSLVPSDSGSADLYDAREGGGFAEPGPAIPCEGDACQSLPAAPEDPAPGTILSTGSGNPPLRFSKPHHHKHHHGNKHHHKRRGHR